MTGAGPPCVSAHKHCVMEGTWDLGAGAEEPSGVGAAEVAGLNPTPLL